MYHLDKVNRVGFLTGNSIEWFDDVSNFNAHCVGVSFDSEYSDRCKDGDNGDLIIEFGATDIATAKPLANPIQTIYKNHYLAGVELHQNIGVRVHYRFCKATQETNM